MNGDLSTIESRRTYNRNWHREKKGHRPQKDIMQVKYAEFCKRITSEQISVAALSKEIGVTWTTGYRWLNRMRDNLIQ